MIVRRYMRTRERDEELNASSYPERLTALKPFHNFLFPFLSELVYLQSMCVCIYLHASVMYPCKSTNVYVCVCLGACIYVCVIE